MTHYVQVVHEHRAFDPHDWTPWKECSGSLEETARLALNKFLRESGYQRAGTDRKPLDVEVYVATDKTPRHAPKDSERMGMFMTCHGIKFRVTPTN